jgi:O-antigen/teichoic acid export membrane protein
LVSTAVSSLGSFILALAMLRSSTIVEYGYFGIAFTFYALTVNLNRAVTGSPLIILFSGKPSNEVEPAGRSAVIISTLVGALAALVGLSIAVGVDVRYQSLFLATCLALPGLLAQDTVRYWYFAKQKLVGAALADVIWTGLQVVCFAVLFWVGSATPVWLLCGWGLSGCLAACVMFTPHVGAASVTDALRALSRQRRTIAPLLVEMGALGAVDFLLAIVIAALASEAVLGEYRAGALILAPFNVLVSAAMVTVVPMGVARHRAGLPNGRLLLKAGSVFVMGPAVIGVFLAVLPQQQMSQLLGGQWHFIHDLIPAWVFTMTAIGISSVALAGLRITQQLNAAMVLRLASLPLIIAVAGLMAREYAAEGAVLGYGVATLVIGGLAVLVLTRSNRATTS